MATGGETHPGTGDGGDAAESPRRPGSGEAKSGGKGSVADQVSNDMSDAKEAPDDTVPKDNSHNFT